MSTDSENKRDCAKPDEDETLCACCANREDCSGGHMMCVDYRPVTAKEPAPNPPSASAHIEQ